MIWLQSDIDKHDKLSTYPSRTVSFKLVKVDKLKERSLLFIDCNFSANAKKPLVVIFPVKGCILKSNVCNDDILHMTRSPPSEMGIL